MRKTTLTLRERIEYLTLRALHELPSEAQLFLSGKPQIIIDGHTLDPHLQLLLKLRALRTNEPLEALTPDLARQRIRRDTRILSGPPIPVASVRDLTIETAHGPIRARHYQTEEAGGPHPLMVFFHGGGFVLGNIDTHDAPARALCHYGGMHVLSVDYRLAPEHPFPAALEDAYAAITWAQKNAKNLNADPDRIVVCGDSAGGNLAAGAIQELIADGHRKPCLQILIYPCVHYNCTLPSRDLFGEDFYLTRDYLEWFSNHYLSPDVDTDDPKVSPLLFKNLEHLPPALVVTAAFDPLRDEAEAYAKALQDAGVPSVLRRMPGMIHGFINLIGVNDSCRHAVIEIAGAARALLATTNSKRQKRTSSLLKNKEMPQKNGTDKHRRVSSYEVVHY